MPGSSIASVFRVLLFVFSVKNSHIHLHLSGSVTKGKRGNEEESTFHSQKDRIEQECVWSRRKSQVSETGIELHLHCYPGSKEESSLSLFSVSLTSSGFCSLTDSLSHFTRDIMWAIISLQHIHTHTVSRSLMV